MECEKGFSLGFFAFLLAFRYTVPMIEQSRINAIISYFFLGPLFLLAKRGTPLRDPYVQTHAKRASKIILIFLMVLGLYFFVKPWTDLSLPGIGIHIHTVMLVSIVVISIVFLMR